MLRQAEKGKIDLILTKSISRLARNTVDVLEATRMLKDKGVDMFFENENLKLKGIDTIEQAEKFRNCYLKINRKDAIELEEDTYFLVDLIGIEVFTESGENLGNIIDVFPTGSNDVYVVKNEEGKQVLLPAIKDVIKSVDIKNKKMVVNLIEGLL